MSRTGQKCGGGAKGPSEVVCEVRLCGEFKSVFSVKCQFETLKSFEIEILTKNVEKNLVTFSTSDKYCRFEEEDTKKYYTT